jgi:hypothetical protein
VREVYELVSGEVYRERTMRLRGISEPKRAREFKAREFDYCTFAGVFSRRCAQDIVSHSGLMVLDFDHVRYLNDLFCKLLYNEYFETQLLFRSPSGDGLKWVIEYNVGKVGHERYFGAVANYIQDRYGVEVDRSGRDLARGCFLCHDSAAYINPDFSTEAQRTQKFTEV